MRVTHVKRNHLQGDGAEEVAGRVGYVGEMLLSLSNLLPGVSEQKNAEGHALDSNPKVWKGKEPAISDRSFVRVWLCDGTATPRSRVSAPSSGNMSQPHKKKPKEARKGGTKTDLAKSKPGVSMSTRSSEEKTKASEPVKVEGSKPMSSTSKSAEKPGSAAAHKSADSCKSKRTAGSSAVSSGAAGVKQQQPQTTATHQSKMGQKVTKTSKLDTKESLAGTLPTKVAGTSLHKNNDSKIQKTKQSCRTDAENVNNLPFKEDLLQKHLEDVMKIIRDMKSQIVSEVTHMIEEQISILKATIVKSLENASIEQKKTVIAPLKNVSEIEDKDPLDLLAETLPSEAPDNSAPKYTGPEVKELDVTKKKGERVGEREDTIPPDYRFKDQPDPKDKGKPTSFSAGPGAKPKTTEKSMTEGDILDSLSADFVQSSAAPVSKCSATSSHSAAPPSTLKQAPLQASTAATVSTSQTGDKDKDPFDLLADTLPSEAPDQSAPKYTGPPVKESHLTKQQIERMGEREDTLPPDYRFKEQPDPKDKGQPASSTGPGAKPKTMTESDVLESLSADFVQSSPATISKCSATVARSAAPPSQQQQAPLQASKAASVSASQTGKKDNDPFDLLAQTLPSEAPDQSAPKYTGPPVKESDATKKQIERVGEREDTIPPDYRFKEQPDLKGKGPLASSASPGAKPKTMTESDVLESLSADFVQSSPATISKCSAAVSHSAALPSLQQQAPLQASTAASVSASQTGAEDKDPFDLLAGTLPSEAPDDSAPKYTGPEVKESDATKKKAERVGEREDTLPPDYRFKEQPTPKDKLASSSTGTGAKPKTMTESDVLDSLSADFVQSPPAPVSKCSAATSHATAPLSMQKEAPLQASTAAPVSAGRTCATGKDAFDLLADTLPSEAPDNSAPKYTGPAVKEPDVTKKKGERVGERDDTIPPDYRFKEQPDPKDKGNLAPSFTGPGAKPKVMTESDVLESLSADFVQSSAAPISKCSATTSQSAASPSMQEAPLKASTAASVSASQTSDKDKDAFDLLAETLPSEAPDNSAPKYTGPEVKESDATKKLIERVGERDDTLPPDYRFGKQADPKDKGKPASSFTSPGAKPKTMAEEDVLDSLSADFVQSSAAPISKCSATVSHAAAPPSKQKQEPQKASTVASVSASQSGLNDKGAFDLLAESLPSEAPDTSAPKYTGPAVKESDSSKKKAERVGETEESIPPDYRFTEQADPKDKGKSNLLSSSTGAETKPETMTERDVLESLSADFVSAAPISKCSAAVSHSAAPPSLQQQAPLQASTVASVSASQSGAKDNDPFDLLAQTLPSEAPDNSAPKYTGPPVKESDVSKKKAERVGETEGSIPPDYRFTEKADPKDKGKLAYSSTDPGAKPKLLTKAELVDNLSSDFDSSSASQISKQKETKEKPAAKSDTKKARKH
ncbi:calpastatin isoform X3 [Pristis pectinata]|uniref:calpastatin isoform X3 n=1 Tax=Pristis pectinata TaxID=685728 RepID=UPI00223D661D|nr:calpastatin isoform X3 [Pristis pectinata]